MPFGVKPVCTSCKITSSPLWRKGAEGEILCNSCGLQRLHGAGKETLQQDANGLSATKSSVSSGVSGTSNGAPALRKSSRIKPPKKSAQTVSKNLSTKGKGRRSIFKKTQPLKAPSAVSTVVTGQSVFHQGQYYQEGDVVSLVDHEGGVYYAQLRGFLADQYNEKSAVLTWLLPTVHSPPGQFDPNTYILGPEEDLPRKMEYMEFVCHAPSDYFRARDAPFKTVFKEPNLCYIWTSIGPEIRTVPSIDEIFGVSDHPLLDNKEGQNKTEKVRSRENSGTRDREKRQVKMEIDD